MDLVPLIRGVGKILVVGLALFFSVWFVALRPNYSYVLPNLGLYPPSDDSVCLNISRILTCVGILEAAIKS